MAGDFFAQERKVPGVDWRSILDRTFGVEVARRETMHRADLVE